MTYKELYEKAIWLLEHNEINGKEYDKMIEPLNAEVGNAEPVRHGHWIDEGLYNDDFPYHAWKCSECGEYMIEIDVPWYKFCPECGAKMERKE